MKIIMLFLFSSVMFVYSQEPTVMTSEHSAMSVLPVKPTIGTGKNKEVNILFKGERRTIVQITLRNNGVLESHSAAEPITIHCIAGSGIMVVGTQRDTVNMQPSTLVTIEPDVIHEIVGTPDISVILNKFSK